MWGAAHVVGGGGVGAARDELPTDVKVAERRSRHERRGASLGVPRGADAILRRISDVLVARGEGNNRDDEQHTGRRDKGHCMRSPAPRHSYQQKHSSLEETSPFQRGPAMRPSAEAASP